MSVFVTAFGGFGAIATHYGLGRWRRPWCFVGGMGLATPIYFFARFLYGQQATSEVRAQDLIGQVGRVVVAIPAAASARCAAGSGRSWSTDRARARPVAIAENDTVVIEEVVGETIVVKRR